MVDHNSGQASNGDKAAYALPMLRRLMTAVFNHSTSIMAATDDAFKQSWLDLGLKRRHA